MSMSPMEADVSHRWFDETVATEAELASVQRHWVAHGVSGMAALNCERAAQWIAEHAERTPPLAFARIIVSHIVQAYAERFPTADLSTLRLEWCGEGHWRAHAMQPSDDDGSDA